MLVYASKDPGSNAPLINEIEFKVLKPSCNDDDKDDSRATLPGSVLKMLEAMLNV